ncbi:glycoside hydrolase family 113 [Maribacter arcticus]|uniref:glycoside hydrolase family 113 n=1 Tax=Maribacter arcticus TaxID=561365 RepID=UPI00300235FC
MKKKYVLLALVVALGIVGYAGVEYFPNTENAVVSETLDSIPTRRELRGSFFEKREILVVYAAKDSVLSNKYEEILYELSSQEPTRSRRSAKILYKRADEVTEENLKENVVFLLGAIQENEVLRRFLDQTPFQVNAKEIKIGSNKITNKNSILSVSFYPNPLMPKMPFSFMTGTDAEQVFDFFAEKVKENGRSFYWQNLNYELYNDNERVVMGDFNEQWKTDNSTFFDFSKGNKVLLNAEKYQFVNHKNALRPNEVRSLEEQIKRNTSKVFAFLNNDDFPKITYNFYSNTEEKGLMTGNTSQAHYDTLNNSIHIIANKIYKNNNIGKDNELLLRNMLGVSKKDILTQGLPIYFTDKWQMKGYKYWSARLAESENTLSVAELLDNSFLEMESSLIRDCLAGAFVDFLMQTWGKEIFLYHYKDGELTTQEIQKLEGKWQLYLKSLSKTYPKEEVVKKELPYLKGFNFAHEGYSIYNGYGSKKATESLLKQKSMGSNAMALVPYTGINNINAATPLRFSNSAGSENDEAVVHALSTAHDMGMYTMLKPQIYVGGSWPGGIEMPSDEEWDLFHDHYYRWIRHYAFLAEIHGMDALCIGVEFTKATLSKPETWRSMIKKTRGLFSGHLTYAANWGEEFENIEFWDDLDYIGLDCYYPLSKKDNPTDEEMSESFNMVKKKIEKVYERFEKPIVFTEIGFRSVNEPWKNPHAEADESINEEMQARCYEIIFKGIEHEPWCQGILWWKFPSFLEYRGEDNNAFTPNNKLAEETVRKWFTK